MGRFQDSLQLRVAIVSVNSGTDNCIRNQKHGGWLTNSCKGGRASKTPGGGEDAKTPGGGEDAEKRNY